jgi:hypothetical protein
MDDYESELIRCERELESIVAGTYIEFCERMRISGKLEGVRLARGKLRDFNLGRERVAELEAYARQLEDKLAELARQPTGAPECWFMAAGDEP